MDHDCLLCTLRNPSHINFSSQFRSAIEAWTLLKQRATQAIFFFSFLNLSIVSVHSDLTFKTSLRPKVPATYRPSVSILLKSYATSTSKATFSIHLLPSKLGNSHDSRKAEVSKHLRRSEENPHLQWVDNFPHPGPCGSPPDPHLTQPDTLLLGKFVYGEEGSIRSVALLQTKLFLTKQVQWACQWETDTVYPSPASHTSVIHVFLLQRIRLMLIHISTNNKLQH